MLKIRGRGRPKKEPTDLITLPVAVDELRKHLEQRYDPVTANAQCLALGTLRNKVWLGQINKYKRGRRTLVSKQEILSLVS